MEADEGDTVRIPPACENFWANAQRAHPELDPSRFLEAFAFGDSERMATELADLVLAGVKRATASLVWTCEHEGKPLPRPGDLSIVTTWAGHPLCIIRTSRVDVVPFEAVSKEFARTEGEGDGSLDLWRRNHAAFFGAQCARTGRTFSEGMLVVCERFDVVYQVEGWTSPARRLAADVPPFAR